MYGGNTNMQKNIKKLKVFYYIIIKHKFIFILVVAVTLIMVFICFPRNIGKLLVHNNNTTISIVKTGDYKQEAHEIHLNEKQQAKLLELFNNSYVRLKVFHKDYIRGDEKPPYMGYSIILSGTMDLVTLFTSEILCINETQYIIYGKTFANEFISIIESEE